MVIKIKSTTGGMLFEGEFLTMSDAIKAAADRKINFTSADFTNPDFAAFLKAKTIVPPITEPVIGYKKLADGSIAILLVPVGSRRLGGMVGNKCRTEFAEIVLGTGHSSFDPGFAYAPGTIVKPTLDFNDNPTVECATGIHFFLTPSEAREYNS